MSESLIEYHDNWNKIKERIIEFSAIMLACSDYPIKLDNYSDIDEIKKSDDYNETIEAYKKMAEDIIIFKIRTDWL